MKYDNTDIHLRYDKARKLPDETIALWLDAISKCISTETVKAIVDLGCGTGRFLNALADYYSATVYGIDPSTKMIIKARESITAEKVIFAQSSAEHLCFADDSVDMVFMSQVYHHFQNKDEAISDIWRILKTNGFFCIRNSTIENLHTSFYLKFFPRAYKDDHKLLSSRNEMKKLLQNNNFSIVEHAILQQKFAKNLKEGFDKIKLRGLSDLEQLPDNEFNKGLKEFELFCNENDMGNSVIEDMDLFVCKKA